MALQSSGAISIANIATEFGGSQPHALNEYYRGGAHVTSNNTNVPTSGQIDLADFYGAVKQSSVCLLYTSPSPRDKRQSRMPSSA